MRFRHLLVSFVVVLFCWLPTVGDRLAADEGMWTFHNPPD